eukprot:15439041-Alexandrium_andersonii.AAC.1
MGGGRSRGRSRSPPRVMVLRLMRWPRLPALGPGRTRPGGVGDALEGGPEADRPSCLWPPPEVDE